MALRFWTVIFFACLALHNAKAEPFVGFSSFAALSPKFPCSRFLHIVNQSDKPAMAVLHGTFGANYDCVNDFIESNADRPHLVEVDIVNGACRRNQRCAEGEIYPRTSVAEFNRKLERRDRDLLSKIIDRVVVIFLAINANDNTTLVMTTGLEDNYTKEAFKVMYETISRRWHFELIRSPMGSTCAGNLPDCESHGVFPDGRARIQNQDGDDLPIQDDREWLRSCVHRASLSCFLWSARAQGIFGPQFVKPRRRFFEITNSDILEYGRLMAEE